LAWGDELCRALRPISVALRDRTGGTLTLYYYGWDKDRIKKWGFQEPPEAYGGEEPKSRIAHVAISPD
jgi:hypothetical protein